MIILKTFLTQEIMDVEHLWFSSRPNDMSGAPPHPSFVRRTLVDNNTADEHMVQTLANMADKRLYKLVKWCKSLPLFKNILVSINSLYFQALLISFIFCKFPSMIVPSK